MQAAAEQKGFSGMMLLADQRSGKAIAIGLWATEADLLAGERSGYEQRQLTQIKDYLVGSPVQEGYEVSVHVEITAQGIAHVRGI